MNFKNKFKKSIARTAAGLSAPFGSTFQVGSAINNLLKRRNQTPKNTYKSNVVSNVNQGATNPDRQSFLNNYTSLASKPTSGAPSPSATPSYNQGSPTILGGNQSSTSSWGNVSEPRTSYMNTMLGKSNQSVQPKSEYMQFLKSMFDPEAARTAMENVNSLNEQIRKEQLRAKEEQDFLNRNEAGMLERGQQYEMSQAAQRSGDALTGLVGARDQSQDVLDQMLEAGATYEEALQAQQEADNELLSVTEAEKLGVPYGTTVSQARGMSITPGMSAGGSSGSAETWAKAIQAGQADLNNAPQELRGSILAAMQGMPQSTSPAQSRALQQANVALNSLNQIFNNPALNAGALGRGIGTVIPGSSSRDLRESVKTVQSLIGFDELQKMRDASPTGGALGQVSEREIDFLQSLAGSMNLAQSDEQLQQNLKNIRTSFEILQLVNLPDRSEREIDGVPFTKSGDQLITQDAQGNYYQMLPNRELVPASFSGVGGDTNQATNIANAIMKVESGGRQVSGASGEFGAFQFMPETWKIVSRQMTGQVLPQTPENEYRVAVAKVQDLLNKGYNAEQIALVWNTSLGGAEKPFVRKGVNSKGVAYDSGAYARKVLSALG